MPLLYLLCCAGRPCCTSAGLQTCTCLPTPWPPWLTWRHRCAWWWGGGRGEAHHCFLRFITCDAPMWALSGGYQLMPSTPSMWLTHTACGGPFLAVGAARSWHGSTFVMCLLHVTPPPPPPSMMHSWLHHPACDASMWATPGHSLCDSHRSPGYTAMLLSAWWAWPPAWPSGWGGCRSWWCRRRRQGSRQQPRQQRHR
jgi:hypothetical protein